MNENAYFKTLSNIYIEVTNKCNINCKYCYEVQKKDSPLFFNYERFCTIIDNVVRYSNSQSISIIFHGGEPLLVPALFFHDCFSYATRTLEEAGKHVDFGLQSNLLLLNDDLIPILKQYNVGVSTSIDGFEDVHNQARGGWKMTIENMLKLKRAGVKVNFIAVCSQHNYEHVKDIFLVAKEYGFGDFQLNIASSVCKINPNSTYVPLTEQQMLDVYIQSLDCWRETGIGEKNLIRILSRFLSCDNDHHSELRCENPFCHAGFNMLVFTPDGQMHMCSPAVPLAKQYPKLVAGQMDKLDDVQRRIDAIKYFHQKDAKYEQLCSICEAACICNFGCPAFDRIDPVSAEHHCGATKRFYKYLSLQNRQELYELLTSKI